MNCKMIGTLSGGKWDKIIDKNRRVYATNNLSPTLTTNGGGNQEIKIMENDEIVRKETPLECFRLMGFSDTDFWYAKYGRDIPVEIAHKIEHRTVTKAEWKRLWPHLRHEQMSNSQLYKQAGNSIVVNVLVAIIGQMFGGKENVYRELPDDYFSVRHGGVMPDDG